MKNLPSFIIIFLFGFYGVYLEAINKLSFYISPRYFTLTIIGAYICVFIGMFGIIYTLEKSNLKFSKLKMENWKSQASPGRVAIGNVTKYLLSNILLIAVLMLALLIPPKPLSARMASNRAGQINNLFIKVEDESILETFARNDEELSLEDWIKSLNVNPDLKNYDDRKVNVIGFVFHEDEVMAEDEFLVSRFIIRCCAVDATPVGLFVKNEWEDKFNEDDWVKVSGVFDVVVEDGRDKLIVIPESIEKTDIPETPYIL